MYAVVRFLDDHDKRLHVIHVHDIEKFDPKDTSDYDNRFVYSAYWRDPVDDTNTGLYNTQVLMLAESEDDARAKMRAKRLVIPKIPMQETTSDDDPDELVESQTKRKKAERKKQKNDRANAKKNMYDEILKKNLEKAHSGRKPRAQPRKGTDTPSDSGSSDSDELCPKSEILQMKKKKDVWKARTKALVVKELEKDRDMWKLRAEELQHDNQFLKQQVASLQRSLESKLFKLAVEQDRVPCSRGMLSAHSETDEGESFVGNLLIMDNMACSERVLPPCSSTAVEPEERTSTVGGEKNTTHPGPNGDFIYMEDGSFHLTKGVTISGVCAKKIFGNKKATLVVKDAAHAIWGSNVLASRSVTGTVGSRKRALGEQPKQPLTPEKLLVVSETLKHWGQQKDVNTADTEKNLPRILAEKIQDLLKSKVRKQMFDDQAQ